MMTIAGDGRHRRADPGGGSVVVVDEASAS
jgi:hypothetical protein